jgi:tRNA(Ile2) C34 agmatinyltransferase TiaS
MITGSRNIFDSNGNLILPRGAIEEFRKEKQLNKARYPTGVYVSCPRCGHSWERQGRSAGTLKCGKCGRKFKVGEIL